MNHFFISVYHLLARHSWCVEKDVPLEVRLGDALRTDGGGNVGGRGRQQLDEEHRQLVQLDAHVCLQRR